MFNECLEIRWLNCSFLHPFKREIKFSPFLNHFVWEVISSIRHSFSSTYEKPRSSSKILRCGSFFQLSSQCFIWWWNTAFHDHAWYVTSSICKRLIEAGTKRNDFVKVYLITQTTVGFKGLGGQSWFWPLSVENESPASPACEQSLHLRISWKVDARVARDCGGRSRVLARLASLAQIGELARRLENEALLKCNFTS